MISLRANPELMPAYATAHSAAADLKSAVDLVIKAGDRGMVPTGVWIDQVNWSSVPEGTIPELQIRARSGLAFKHGIMLTNGIGTVDADYPNEICVLLYNSGSQDFQIKVGDRIAQITVNLVQRMNSLTSGEIRIGGFGSTGISDLTSQAKSN